MVNLPEKRDRDDDDYDKERNKIHLKSSPNA